MSRGTPLPGTVTLHVPFRVVKRGGRKEMRLPEGAAQPRRTDSTLVTIVAHVVNNTVALVGARLADPAEADEPAPLAVVLGGLAVGVLACAYVTYATRRTPPSPEGSSSGWRWG